MQNEYQDHKDLHRTMLIFHQKDIHKNDRVQLHMFRMHHLNYQVTVMIIIIKNRLYHRDEQDTNKTYFYLYRSFLLFCFFFLLIKNDLFWKIEFIDIDEID